MKGNATELLNRLIYEEIDKHIKGIVYEGISEDEKRKIYLHNLNPWILTVLSTCGLKRATDLMEKYFPNFKRRKTTLLQYDYPDEKQAWDIISRIMIPYKWAMPYNAAAFRLTDLVISKFNYNESDFIDLLRELGYIRKTNMVRAFKYLYHYFIKNGFCIEKIYDYAHRTGSFNILSELVDYGYNLDKLAAGESCEKKIAVVQNL